MVLETLGSGLLGGLLRFAPEVLKHFDKKGERAHELALLSAEMKFTEVRGEIAMRQTEAAISVAGMDAIAEANREQGQTARSAGWFVAGLSALVRPMITYWFVTMYSAVKVVSMKMAVDAGADWQVVLVSSWTEQDWALLVMILVFWFAGRPLEKMLMKRG